MVKGRHQFTRRLGEILLSLVFILGGGATLMNPQPRAAQIKRLCFPLAEVAVRVNALGMVVAGLFLALGLWTRAAARVLIALLIPTTLFGHAFWLESGFKRQEQLAHFLKNLGLLGGLLLETQVARQPTGQDLPKQEAPGQEGLVPATGAASVAQS